MTQLAEVEPMVGIRGSSGRDQNHADVHHIGVCGTCFEQPLTGFEEMIRVVDRQGSCGIQLQMFGSTHDLGVDERTGGVGGTVFSISATRQDDDVVQ